MEANRSVIEPGNLGNLDSGAEEASGAIGKVVPALGEVATYEDLKYELRMLEREERFAQFADEDESVKRQRVRANIIANAVSGQPARPHYFVRNSGL